MRRPQFYESRMNLVSIFNLFKIRSISTTDLIPRPFYSYSYVMGRHLLSLGWGWARGGGVIALFGKTGYESLYVQVSYGPCQYYIIVPQGSRRFGARCRASTWPPSSSSQSSGSSSILSSSGTQEMMCQLNIQGVQEDYVFFPIHCKPARAQEINSALQKT